MPETRCVPLEFERAPLPGGYCLRRFGDGCPRPFSKLPTAVASLSGAAPEYFCGPNPFATRCEAILDLVEARSCDDGEDRACGCPRDADGRCTAEGTGGLCRTVDGVAHRCTVPCGTVNDCPIGKTCSIDTPYCH